MFQYYESPTYDLHATFVSVCDFVPELDKKQIFLVTFDIAYIALYNLRTGEAYEIYAASSLDVNRFYRLR